MAKVRVVVSQLAIDIGNEDKIFRKGEEFDCPADRAVRLGNSVVILEAPVEPEKKAPTKTRPAKTTK